MKPANILLIVLIVLQSALVFSQNISDTLLFVNGKKLVTTVTDIDTVNALISFIDTRNPKKIKTIESDRVFSVTDSAGEHVIYMQDTIGNELTETEMRQYIFGQQDARKIVKGYAGVCINTALSLGAGLTGTFVAPATPFLVAGALGLFRAKPNEDKVEHPEYVYNDPYKMGYEREGKRIRKVRSLLGGSIGLVLGLTTYGILKDAGQEILK